MVVITDDRRDIILQAVRAMYTDVARSPEKQFHFPTGRAACEFVGYPAETLDRVPAAVLESFAGVGYPFAADVIGPGDVVLDIGSGSGTDVFVARDRVGPTGAVIGLDMTLAMREKLRANLEAAGVDNVRVLEGHAEEIPLPDASVDVVTSNGVLNLVPDKLRAIAEIERVLRPAGRVQIADIVLSSTPAEACRRDPELWAECIVGATTEEGYLGHFRAAGFTAVSPLSYLDYFSRSANRETRAVAESLGAHAIVMRAQKPASHARPAAHGSAGSEALQELPGRAGQPVESPPPSAPPPFSVHEGIPGKMERLLEVGTRGCGDVNPLVRQELRELEPGQVLGVRSALVVLGTDLAAWCRLAGHEFLGSEVDEGGDAVVHFIRKRNA